MRVAEMATEFGKFKPLVTALTGNRLVTQFGQTYDPWLEALTVEVVHSPNVVTSLRAVTQAVNEAIGHIKGDRLRQAIPDLVSKSTPPRPTVFISHDGESSMRDRLEMECWRTGLNPVVVEARTSHNESVDDKVDRLLDEAVFAIVLARREVGADQDGRIMPRGSVIDEISRIRSKLGDKFIVLLERGMELPATLSTGIIYEEYSQENFDRPILSSFKAMRDYGVL